MTRLSTTFSARLNAVLNFIERNIRFIFLFLAGLILLAAYIIRDLFLPLYLTLVMLPLLTIYVARLTRKAAKDKSDAHAKVGRLWLEFAFVLVASLVVVVIQYDQVVRSNYLNAVSQLDSFSPAERMSGIDYLNDTCMGEKKEPHPHKCNKDETIKLLNNQVKFFTQSKSYRENFEEAPSGDIVQIIKILTEIQELDNIMWEGAYLRGADLGWTNLQEARLLRTNLQGADLGWTNLQRARLLRTNLQGADLREANLQRADMYEAHLQGANLRKTNLQRADLGEANLQEADLYGTNLQEANLRKTNLQRADLYEVHLQGADMRDANLQGADLYETNLQEADLSRANLQGAVLYEANLQRADLRGAKLQGANLYKAKLQGANLYEANLQGAYSEYEISLADFCTRIISRIGKPTEIDMDIIPNEFKNEVNTGTLTKKTAIEIIKEYNDGLTDEQARCELPQ